MDKFGSGENLPLKSVALLSALLIVMTMDPLAVAAGQPGVFWRMLHLAVFCAGGYLLMEGQALGRCLHPHRHPSAHIQIHQREH